MLCVCVLKFSGKFLNCYKCDEKNYCTTTTGGVLCGKKAEIIQIKNRFILADIIIVIEVRTNSV